MLDKIYTAVKSATPYVVAVPTLLYGGSLLAKYLDKKLFEFSISKTRDWITSELEGDIYHYRIDRVLEQKYPYKYYPCREDKYTGKPDCSRSHKNNYKEVLNGDPLLLMSVWYDKKTYPELKGLKKAKANGDWGSESCVGVDLTRSPNPGGGWRPNLNCIEEYVLGEVTQHQEQLIKEFTNLANDDTIEGSDLEEKIDNILPNIPPSDTVVLMESIKEYRNDPNFGID